MIVHITRFIFVAAGALGGYAVNGLIDWPEATGYSDFLVIFIFLILGTSIGYILGGILGRELAAMYLVAEERLRILSPADIALGTVGLVVGLVIAFLGSQPLRLVQPTWIAIIATTLLFLLASSLGVRIALLKRDDLAHVFPRFSAPEVALAAQRELLLLDTSAVIDGRFSELMRLNLLGGDVSVPRFVLAELQTLADSADEIKRARGRRGLDLLTRIQADDTVNLFEADYPDLPAVDDKLMRLALDSAGTIITVDYNLTKVAGVRDIRVINLNEIAAALKPAYLPGESLSVHLTRLGKEADQGVGYLQDGTMIVVHDGSAHVGADVVTEVTSVLQTSAGRMIFAKFAGLQSLPDASEES
ncbi:MAG: PIN domain nuclease [Actinomycetota bacterium]|nr:PIN domain nuclease [Actinomycetota bacterium]